MKIEHKKYKLKEIYKEYKNNKEEGVIAFDGKLNVRPAYQREFVYNEEQMKNVIHSIMSNFPLNTMYWAKNEDGTFEVIDGQQRTISFCDYMAGDFSIKNKDNTPKYYHSLSEEEKRIIDNYEVSIYICEGDDKEKLNWFKIVNTPPAKLTDQELRNAIYSGTWISDAREKFSKRTCIAYNKWNKWISGNAIRQDYLESALKWISDKENVSIEEYMSKHEKDENANELWEYFDSVLTWADEIFHLSEYVKTVKWGILYNKYSNFEIKKTKEEIKEEIDKLLIDDEIDDKKGIYEYFFSRDDKHLHLRKFPEIIKKKAYQIQNGNCKKCKNHFEYKDVHADHIKPWSKGGKTIIENCQILCSECNLNKSDN